MKHYKQAQTSSLLVKVVIAVVVLLMLSMIFFAGDDSQFGQIKKLLPSFNSEVKPDEYAKANYEFASTEEKGEIVYSELFKGLQKLQDDPEQNCFYFLPSNLPYDALDDDLWIRIDSGTATSGAITSVLLEAPMAKIEDSIKNGNYYSQSGAPKAKGEIGGDMCVIIGSAAEKFVESVKDKKDFNPNTYYSFNQLIIEHNTVYINGFQAIARLKTNDYRLGLVKMKDDLTCIIITEGNIGNKCKKASTSLRGAIQKTISSPNSPLYGIFANELDASGGNFLTTDCFETKEIATYRELFITYYPEIEGGKCLSRQDYDTIQNMGEEGKDPVTI